MATAGTELALRDAAQDAAPSTRRGRDVPGEALAAMGNRALARLAATLPAPRTGRGVDARGVLRSATTPPRELRRRPVGGRCACGGTILPGGECSECLSRRLLDEGMAPEQVQRSIADARALARTAVPDRLLQRTIGDGHDLTSPRFSLIEALEAAYDGERSVKRGARGRAVQAIQQALYDIGFSLPDHGADGDFGSETEAAVKDFQRANPPLVVDGKVGRDTMTVLDARFAAFTLPSAADRAATWSPACVLSILCPWTPHTVDVLRTRITLKSFDSISWDDEEWDGSAWVPAPFPGGGYNTGTEIGVLNSSCESMAETLYHEVLHAEQPSTQRTTLAKESYAYRIGEEFSIAAGLHGRPDLRSTDARSREFADRAKVEAFVRSEYPSVPSSGAPSEEIIGKAATLGHVRVQRADGSVYTRPAAVGERVPGPINLTNEVTHPAAPWTCP